VEEIAAGYRGGPAGRGESDQTSRPCGRQNADSVIHRFRKDAHEIVDILVDLVGTAAKYAEEMGKRAVSFRVSGTRADLSSRNRIPRRT
jgi:hypothetical protein